MWFHRRILRALWRKHISNEEVYGKMEAKRIIIFKIGKRQMKFPGQETKLEKFDTQWIY